MRRIISAAAALALMSTTAMADIVMGGDVAFDEMGWEGRRSYRNYDPMPQMVRSILQMERSGGMDNWAWRDNVENQLFALGPGALSYIQAEAATREGFEGDALQVALFRLQNTPLAPREALLRWGQRHFAIPSTPEPSVFAPPSAPPPNPLKIHRIMDSRDGAGLAELFPHHLFYVLQYKTTRVVVALAADAKVQLLNDDTAIARFFRVEGTPRLSVNDKSQLASAAALLMLARSVTPYRPEFRPTLDTDFRTYKYTLQFEGNRQTALLTFNRDGTLETLSGGNDPKPEIKAAAPITAPTTTAPPPAMPE